MPGADLARDRAFGQEGRMTALDRVWAWQSGSQTQRTVGSLNGMGDFGCGFEETFIRSPLSKIRSATSSTSQWPMISSRIPTVPRSKGPFLASSLGCLISHPAWSCACPSLSISGSPLRRSSVSSGPAGPVPPMCHPG
jgi:hypothetical protein